MERVTMLLKAVLAAVLTGNMGILRETALMEQQILVAEVVVPLAQAHRHRVRWAVQVDQAL